MTLVPEGNPAVDKASILGEHFTAFREALADSGMPVGILLQATMSCSRIAIIFHFPTVRKTVFLLLPGNLRYWVKWDFRFSFNIRKICRRKGKCTQDILQEASLFIFLLYGALAECFIFATANASQRLEILGGGCATLRQTFLTAIFYAQTIEKFVVAIPDMIESYRTAKKVS